MHQQHLKMKYHKGTTMQLRIHTLKTNTGSFDAIVARKKKFTSRKHDRDFRIGDVLALQEWTPKTEYTGRVFYCEVTDIYRGGQYGILRGCVALSIEPLPEVLANAIYSFSGIEFFNVLAPDPVVRNSNG